MNDLINKLINLNVTRPIFEVFCGDIAQIKGEWDEAMLHFEKASQSNTDIVKAEGIIKYGEIQYRLGNLKESLNYFERAYDFSKRLFLRKEEARALNDIGLVYFESDKTEIANDKLIEALRIRKEINDREGIATSYNNVANIFGAKGKGLKALEQYYESLKIAEQDGNKVQLAIYLRNIGSKLRELNKLDEAILKINLALKICEEIGEKAGIGYCLNTLGLIFIDQGKSEDAFLMLEQGLRICEEIKDKRGIARIFCSMGNYYSKFEKNYNSSLYYLLKSFALFKQTKNRIELKNALFYITALTKKIGKIKFKELAFQVYDKLDSETKSQIQIKDFFNEPSIRESPKIRRNDHVSVRYHINGLVKENIKFKTVEADINEGKCKIIKETGG